MPVFTIFITLAIIVNSRAPLYDGPPSDHFDGRQFFNPVPDHTFWDEVKWLWEMETVAWPAWITDPAQPPPPRHVGEGELRVTYINHATMLVQMDGVNILTDPMWSYRSGPFSWLGACRVRAPGVEMDSLPRIDVVLLSHDHYDHLDLPTLRDLENRYEPIILGGLGIKNFLEGEGFKQVVELDWWQEYRLGQWEMSFTFVPALHNSGRGLFRGNQVLWGGFVVQGLAGNVYYAGDTGSGSFLREINERFHEFRLAILPLGNYEKRWFMKNRHMNPDDAVQAHLLLNAGQSVGMHYATFLEHPEQLIDAHETDLAQAMKEYGLIDSAFWILEFGEGRDVPPTRK